MELLEWVAFATIVTGFTAVTGMIIAIISLVRTETQIRKQAKIQSAQLSLDLIKRVQQKDFAKVVDQIFDNTSNECDPVVLERLLNHCDLIAKFNDEDLLTTGHISQIYDGLLCKIKKDPHIQSFITKNKESFQLLIKLYNKI